MEGLRRGGGSWGRVPGDKGMMGTAPGWRFHSPDRRHCVLGREETAGHNWPSLKDKWELSVFLKYLEGSGTLPF